MDGMTPKLYEASLLAHHAYRASKSDDPLEILCIACVFRNRVFRYGKTYSQVLENAEVNRGWPSIQNPALIDPTNGILNKIEDIYDGTAPDFSANHNFKDGALWFCDIMQHQGTGDWFETEILMKPEEHALIGKFGALWFYV